MIKILYLSRISPMRKLISISFLLLLSCTVSFGQSDQDFGSVKECYGKTFSIVAWVLTDTAGTTTPLTQASVEDAIDSVNNKFAGMCVDFKLCEYNVLPNHRQDTIEKGLHDAEIAALYRKKNVINLYFATEIINPDPTPGPCGYAPLGTEIEPEDTSIRDAIFLKKD
jgi:hypothetical protein